MQLFVFVFVFVVVVVVVVVIVILSFVAFVFFFVIGSTKLVFIWTERRDFTNKEFVIYLTTHPKSSCNLGGTRSPKGFPWFKLTPIPIPPNVLGEQSVSHFIFWAFRYMWPYTLHIAGSLQITIKVQNIDSVRVKLKPFLL